MALELRQSLKLSQQLVMTPQLQLAIKLLDMSRLELQQKTYEELDENPALEVDIDDVVETVISPTRSVRESESGNTFGSIGGSEDPEEEHVQDAFDEISYSIRPSEYLIPGRVPYNGYIPTDQAEWQVYFGEYLPLCEGYYDLEGEFDKWIGVCRPITLLLFDYLETQINLLDLPETERTAALYLIGNIDENGYLTVTDEEAAGSLSLPVEDVARAVAWIQTLDPLGVGGRDLRECLLIQARERGAEFDLPVRILTDHFKLFSRRDVEGVARRLMIPRGTAKEAFQKLATLWPKPGRAYSGDDVHYITPDVYIFKVDDRWIITLNEDEQPRLRVSSYYHWLLAGGGEELTKENWDFLKQKVNSALWFIKSIEQRKRTIYKVVESIMKLQRDFLEKGPKHMRLLTLRDVAEEIGMHESTVSRVTSGKYVYTPHGIYELKYFFTSSLNRDEGEEDIASKSVMEKIRDIIQAEGEKRKTLSNKDLMRLLQNQGVQISWRTMKKYRMQLGMVLSSRRRRQF